MLYNTTHKLTKIIGPPAQEDIYNCPHYFAMSYDQVKKSGAPEFLIKLLDQFPFDGRKNILQIRPQDFRSNNVSIDGRHWHTDYNVRLLNNEGGQFKVYSDGHNDFHLMVISWGAGCSTEFIDTPFDLPDNLKNKDTQEDWENWNNTLNKRLEKSYDIISSPKNQMVEYTTTDLHRADGIIHSKGLRLMIVAFDCNNINGNIRILPSIRNIDSGTSLPQYLR